MLQPGVASHQLAHALASDADRQQVSVLLQNACSEGRLSLDEFSQRIERAIAARTHADLVELTHDLPPRIRQPAPRPADSSSVILSSAPRRPWQIGERSETLVLFGSCKLDLRRAALSPGVTVIDASIICGSRLRGGHDHGQQVARAGWAASPR
jgi:hypothetical protein